MASHTLFPGIIPGDNGNGDEEFSRYRELDWNSLRPFANGIGVNGKQKRPGIIHDLDDYYNIENMADYARRAHDMDESEYRAEFDPDVEVTTGGDQ